MKSIIKITTLIVASILIFSAGIYADQDQIKAKSHNYDASTIITRDCSNVDTENELVEFNFEEEKYIDDIAINTENISSNLLYKKAMAVEFSFEEEEYINDISL